MPRRTLMLVGVGLGAAMLPANAWAWESATPRGFGVIADGGPAPLLTPHARYASDDGQSAAISAGRVWWLSSTTTAERRFVVRSRSLSSGKQLETSLDTAALTPPTGVNDAGRPFDSVITTQVSVRDGKIVVLGDWVASPTQVNGGGRGSRAPSALQAVFDGTSGALIRQQNVVRLADGANPVVLIDGAPATFSTSSQRVPSSRWDLQNPIDLTPLAGHGQQIADGYTLAFTSGSEARWRRGQGTLTVSSVSTGRMRYRVSYKALRVAAGPITAARAWLLPDGSLRVTTHANATRRTRAIAVTSTGAVKKLTSPMRGVTEAVGLVGHQRAFVALRGSAPSSKRRCDKIWITSTAGSRGRELTRAGAGGRQGAPTFWDGKTAVWTLNQRPSFGADRVRVRTENGLRRLSLRRRDTPGCD